MFYFLLFISWGKVCLECINECRILMGCDVDVRGSLLRCFYFEFFVIGVCDMCFLWLKNCFILKFMIIMMIIVIIIYYILVWFCYRRCFICYRKKFLWIGSFFVEFFWIFLGKIIVCIYFWSFWEFWMVVV